MPELVEQMYCSQQIVIPPKFPYILKKYCKAAIKTQPYDLLRWSFEYFRALAEHRPPPVKLRLEYPIYSSEGGLTRGCHKVLANQLIGMTDIPMPVLKRAWQGFCLEPMELRRILCLCEVYQRADSVPFLNFIAVAAGMLTKCLTHTMILLCESLTKEPDGGSSAIPLRDFLKMYRFLASIDASADVKYYNGYREGQSPEDLIDLTEGEPSASMDFDKDKEKMLKQMSGVQVEDETDDDKAKGMVAGRQMSTTSGEFIVQTIEKEILAYIDDQIAILPDPDLKKKKAKPEEVAMIRDLLETFIDENMDVIVPEVEEVEEEEQPIPEIIVVYAVPGIGGIVEAEIVTDFEDYAREACRVQSEVIMPRNLRHYLCPPLEMFEEFKPQKKEEAPIGGGIAD